MSLRKDSRGFSLLELLVVVAILGIVATIAVGLLRTQIDKAIVSAVATDLRSFETGFLAYASDHDGFPSDSHLEGTYNLPPDEGVEAYLPKERWASATQLGGNYNWEGPDFYSYAAIAFFEPTAPASMFAKLDASLDDGDLSQGKFRITSNGRYTYVIQE